MSIRSLTLVVLCLSCLVSAGKKGWGQTSTATLQGVVTDPTGAFVPRATVKIQHLGTGLAPLGK